VVRKLWHLLAPFHRIFLLFLILITAYELVQLANSYVLSLVVRYFDQGIQPHIWLIVFVSLLVFDEINMRLDNAVDWHIIAKHSHPIYRFLKLAAIAKFLRMDITWHRRHNSGTLVGKVGDGVWKTLEIIDTLSWEFIPTLIQAIISLIPLLIISPWAAILAALTFVVFAWITVKGNREKQPFRSIRHDYYEKEWNKAIESVQSVETNLMFGQQERLMKDQAALHDGIINEAQKEHHLGVFKYNRWRIRILTFARRLILIIWIVQLTQGNLDIANLIFANVLIERLFHSFWRFARLLDRTSESGEGSGRLVNLLYEDEPKETGCLQTIPTRPIGISLKNVCFAYDGEYSEADGALHDLNLEISPGQVVALVGPSGAGKTTIRKIITRLIPVQHGEIRVGGININDWDGKQLLSLFSYVPQGDDVYIFDESIAYNIAFPRPDATPEEIENAAKLAGIHDFVYSLKDSYNTVVGERGVRLSGGQKQRVALARAILADRPILILDEATSAVDSITEDEIQTNMSRILSGKTAIIIAHRLSTIKKADKIVVMDQGRKVEEGTQQELIDKKGLYYLMDSLQKE